MSQTFNNKPGGVFSQCKDARRDVVGLQSFQSFHINVFIFQFTSSQD